MPPRALLLNGPPRSGKDYIGAQVISALRRGGAAATVETFKGILIDKTCERFGVARERFMENYETEKETPVPWLLLGGAPVSRRQALIHHSENELKPQHGPDVFAKLWCQHGMRPVDKNHVYVFTDCGFQEEVDTLVAAGLDVAVLRLQREGTSFSSDSRSYVDRPNACADYQNTTAEDARGFANVVAGFLCVGVGAGEAVCRAATLCTM